jgi:hypothetical protein
MTAISAKPMISTGREQTNDTVLLVTDCFQYRPTDAPDPNRKFELWESGRSTLEVRSGPLAGRPSGRRSRLDRKVRFHRRLGHALS